MSKKKKFTFNMFAAKAAKMEPVNVKCDWFDESELIVTRVLPAEKAFNFVNDIAAACIDAQTGEYIPECLDYAMRVNVLVYYAGFDEPVDIKKAYRVLYETDLFDTVFDAIDHSQFDILMEAVHNKIAYETNAHLVAISAKIDEAVDKIGATMNSSVNAISEFMSPEFNERVKEITGVINAGDVRDTAPAAMVDTQKDSGTLVQVLKDE